MKINGFRCDTCGKEHTSNLFKLHGEGVPFGWYSVEIAALLRSNPWVFCSKPCLSQWAREEEKSHE